MKREITFNKKMTSFLLSCCLSSFAFAGMAQSIVIEAEDGAVSYAQRNTTLTGFSGGAGIGELKAHYNSFVQYEVSVPAEGTYDLAIDYATMSVRHLYVKVNEQVHQVVKFDDLTGSWNGLEGEVENEEGEMVLTPGIKTKTIQVYLEAGENLLEVGAFEAYSDSEKKIYGEGPNLDKFVLSPSETILPRPADQIELIVLNASEADKLNGGAKQGKNMLAFSDEKGIVDMNSKNQSYFRFNTVAIEEEGTYDLSVYYTTMDKRYAYSKVNKQEKNVSYYEATTSSWGDKLSDDPNRPSVYKKTVQVYFEQGNNSIEIGAYNGWGPNVDRLEIVKSGLSIEKPGFELFSAKFDYTDIVGVEFKESLATDPENLKKLIDNNEYTYYVAEGVNSVTIEAKTTYPILLTGYGLAAKEGGDIDVSTDWTLEYSIDGQAWNTVAVTGVVRYGHLAVLTTGYKPADDAPVSAQYYRLTATGNGKVEIGDWQLYGLPYTSASTQFLDNLLNNPDNLFASDDGFNRGGDWNEVYENSIDRNVKTKYTVVDKKTFTLTYETDETVSGKSYALTIPYAENLMGRNPSQWTVDGYSAETGDWVTLHSVENITFPTPGATLMFNIPDPIECDAYRLNVLNTAGESTIHLLQWQLFGDYSVSESSSLSPDRAVSKFKVYGASRELVIVSDEAQEVNYNVYNMIGSKVATGICAPGTTYVPLPGGIYIVQVNNEAFKIIVK